MQINRLMFAMLATLAAILLASTNASAFVIGVTPDVTTLYVNEAGGVTFTVSGGATDTTLFSVGVTPDALFEGADVSFMNQAAINDSITGGAWTFFTDNNGALVPQLYADLHSTSQDNTGADIAFSIAQGSVIDFIFNFDGITGPKSTGIGKVMFQVCVTANAVCTAQTFTVPIEFKERNANNVPEPATLWLAAAALIAGGLIFRKDSKSS